MCAGDRGAAATPPLASRSGCTSLPRPLQESWERLLASSRYNEQEGFAAVFQPFLSQPALEPPSVSAGDLRPRPLPPSSPAEPRMRGLGKTLRHSLILS